MRGRKTGRKGGMKEKKEERVRRERKELNHSSTREKSNCGKVCNLNPMKSLRQDPVFARTIVLVGY